MKNFIFGMIAMLAIVFGIVLFVDDEPEEKSVTQTAQQTVETAPATPVVTATQDKSSTVEPFKSKLPKIYAGAWFNGKPFKYEENLDKILVLEFWATWCPPCRASIPHLKEMNAKYKDKNVVFISISNESKETIEKFYGKAGMDWLVGAESNCSDDYGVRGIPHAFVIKNDSIVWDGHPMGGLEEEIEKLTAN